MPTFSRSMELVAVIVEGDLRLEEVFRVLQSI
jgi:hypothetical protein